MGLLSNLFSKPKAETPVNQLSDPGSGLAFMNMTLSQPDDWFINAITGSASAAGMKVNALSALGVPTVYACVNAVSRSMSSLPLKLYKNKAGGGKEPAVDHPLYSLLHDAPNEEMTSADFRRAMQANATLRNNAYALIVRNGLGQIAELQPIPNHEIKAERDQKTNELFYIVNGENIAREKILHIRGLTFNGVSGLDNVGVAKEPIGLAMALQDHGAKYFVNASSPSLGIEIPHNLSEQQLKEFAAKWDAVNSGNANAHKRAIFHGGAKPANLTFPTNQAGQFVEAKIYQDKCICQIYGVPQIKVGILEDNHYATSEQENQNYVTDTLLPWAVQWEQALNYKLLTPRERGRYFFKFELSGLLRANTQERFAAYQIALNNGIMSRNEVREKEDLNPVEGGDLFTISQNVQLLDEAGKPLPPPEPPAAQPATSSQ